MSGAMNYVLITDPGSSAVVESDSFGCCHCQMEVMVHIGSGIKRGYCFMCNAPTCGGKDCKECRPFMKRIEEQENRARLHAVIQRGCDSF